MRRQRGFSLIELLIVVAIILALAAMAVPNLIRSKMSANEASAVGSLHAIANAQASYAISYAHLGYANQLSKLAYPPAGQAIDHNHAGIIDIVLGCEAQPCKKSGYQFSIINPVGTPTIVAYTAVGTPLVHGTTGRRGFCSDSQSHISYDPDGGTSCTLPLE
jgi:prepilin-type N-terminal cleavage/methylation domain-containing protein